MTMGTLNNLSLLPDAVIDDIAQGRLEPSLQIKFANHVDSMGHSPAFIALKNDHFELALSLLSLEGNISKTTTYGWSIFHLIAKMNADLILENILKSKPFTLDFLLSLNASERNCIEVAAYSNSYNVLAKLLHYITKHCSTEMLQKIKAYALMAAAEKDSVDCARVLLKMGVNLTIRDPQTGESIVQKLIRCNASKTFELLKNHVGMEVLMDIWYQSTNSGKSAADYAIELGHWNMAMMILSLQSKGIDTLQWSLLQKLATLQEKRVALGNHPAFQEELNLADQFRAYIAEKARTGLDFEKIPAFEVDQDIIAPELENSSEVVYEFSI